MKPFERADGALLTTALVLPACLLCARWSVWRVVCGAVAALIILYCISRMADRLPEDFRLPRWYCALRLGWCALTLGWCAALTRGLFPQSDSVVIPAVMLLLAATACAKGKGAPARVGAVLWPFVLAMLAVVFVFAIPDIRLSGLQDTGALWQAGCAAALLLLPGMQPLRRGRAKRIGFLLLALPIVCIPAVVCMGLLGSVQTTALELPMYAATQSISVLGVMERFEVLLSGALTASSFCVMCYLIENGIDGLPWQEPFGRQVKVYMLGAVGFGLMIPAQALSPWVLGIGNAIFCGLIPVGILGFAVKKSSQKK